MLKTQTLAALAAELQSTHAGKALQMSSEMADRLLDIISYQLPLKVTEYMTYATSVDGIYDEYELCPKCGLPLERTYQPHCDKCGQTLQWISKRGMTWRR